MFSSLARRSFATVAPNSKGKLVLLYSGGLDTSCVLKWLLEDGYDVLPLICDIGQHGEDFEASRQKALDIGASKVFVEDIREDFMDNYVFPSIQANGIYEDRYLLGTSLARYPISKKAIEIALQEGAVAVGHGATGKGNDQVRFEMSMMALAPHLEMVTPWRNPDFFKRFEGRQDLIEYAQASGIPVAQTKEKSFSTDENMFHVSYESGVLEDPWVGPPKGMFMMTTDPEEAPDQPENVVISFEDGIPKKVALESGEVVEGSVNLMNTLNELGMKHGVGRIDIVENRFVGMKSRGVYETPGGTILRNAHLDLEGMTVDREVRKLRDMFSQKFSELAYNGFWFSPEMEYVLKAMRTAQDRVTGDVRVKLYKGSALAEGRTAPYGLYDPDLASMDKEGGYDPIHAEGFIKINSMRLRTYRSLMEKMGRPLPK